MKVDVFNLKREKVGELDLSDEVFGAEVKEHLFYEVVKAQLASRRAGHRGRQGARSRQRLHEEALQAEGHGPRAPRLDPRADHRRRRQAHALEPRDWSYRPPRKVRIGALKSALSLFAKEGRLIVVDSLELAEIKTKGSRRRAGDAQGRQEGARRRRQGATRSS